MILVEHLRKSYGAIAAVRDVSFSVPAGAVAGLLGPNGAGKSTTLRVLSGCIEADDGAIMIGGSSRASEAAARKQHIGYLPEDPPVWPELTVAEFIGSCGALHGLRGSRLRARVAAVLEQCQLGEVARRLCGGLSRGLRQRAGLAQALVHEPEVLILDEPTSGLDPIQVVEIRKLIRSLGGQHTVLISTHVLAEAAQLCDRVIVISGGRTVLERELKAEPDAAELERVFLASVTGAAEAA